MKNSTGQCSAAHGFMLFNMIVTVLLVTLLAALAFPRFIEVRDRSYVRAAHYHLAALRYALAVYAIDHDGYPPSAASYEEFKKKLVDTDGNPYITLPSGQTFRWVSYVNVYSNSRKTDYLLVIQVLDQNGTTITATADGVQISP